jgi:type II secretory pathway pseudopilin PulG
VPGSGHFDRGFTYLGLLLTIMLMTSALAAVAGVWEVGNRREKEIELLFIGEQFRNALADYQVDGTNPVDRSPRELKDLVKDARVPGTRRYLRKVYTDPMTGTAEWGLLRNVTGGIVGVFSKSEREPLKKANFSKADKGFEGKLKYSDWVFVSQPKGGNAPPPPAQGTNPPVDPPVDPPVE